MTRLSLTVLFAFLLTAFICLVQPAAGQDEKKEPAAKKDEPKAKSEAKKDEPKKEEKKEEPKKEPFVPDVPLKELKGHSDWVNAVAISSDSKVLASASRDRTVRIWDLESGKELAVVKGSPENLKAVAFVNGSAQVAFSTGKWNKEKKAWEGEIRVWDTKAGKEIKSIKGHEDTIDGLAISPDGKLLASASEDKTIKIWELASGKNVQTLTGHVGIVEALAFSRDGAKLASGGGDGIVMIWDPATGKALISYKVEVPVKQPETKDKKAEGKKKAEKKEEAKKEEAKKDEPKKDEAKKEEAKKEEVKKSDAKKDVAKKDEAKKDETKKEEAKKEDKKAKKETITMEPGRPFTCLVFAPDGKTLYAGNLDGTIKIYNLDQGKAAGELKAHDGVWALAESPDGRTLASGGWDQTIKVWDRSEKKQLFTIKAHNGTVTSLAFTPDGRYIVSASTDGTLKIWNAASAPTN